MRYVCAPHLTHLPPPQREEGIDGLETLIRKYDHD
jgi:hypothetical protein